MSTRILAELSCEAAVRALDVQERAIEQLRQRTGTLLAASSLTASFLGAQAIQRAHGMHELWKTNQEGVESLARLYLSAAFALMLQLILWLLVLAANIR